LSAKGRAIVKYGGPEDYFTTPSWVVRRLLEQMSLPGGVWVEPSAGNGAIMRAVNAVRDDVQWLACELREEERDALALIDWCRPHIGNFLTEEVFPDYASEVSVVLGNPPYSHAFEFLLRAHHLFPAAEIVLLLRQAFTASQERYEFMSTHFPDKQEVPDRISFTGDGSDSADYAWMRWPAAWERTEGSCLLLAQTPLVERKLDHGHIVQIESKQRTLF
jgi:hypothetical protein